MALNKFQTARALLSHYLLGENREGLRVSLDCHNLSSGEFSKTKRRDAAAAPCVQDNRVVDLRQHVEGQICVLKQVASKRVGIEDYDERRASLRCTTINAASKLRATFTGTMMKRTELLSQSSAERNKNFPSDQSSKYQ